MLDSKGLVCKSRLHELQHHKIDFAHDEGEKMHRICWPLSPVFSRAAGSFCLHEHARG